MPAREDVTFGLVGRVLGHSWSPQIHALLGSMPYDLVALEPDEVEGFIRHGSWKGLNVTIPYKGRAFELADEASDRARRLGVANTLVRRPDGSIYADNTDLAGFAWMLDRFCRRELGAPAMEALAGQETLVLGSGGASQAIQAALADAGARVSVISRHGDDTYQTLAERHPGAFLVVNTTPVGMFPNCPASPLTDEDFDRLERLAGVLDVVYNPARTGICLQAEKRHIPCESGLAMLVGQARASSELFQGHAIPDDALESVEAAIRTSKRNIALIGMPGAGKTTCGRALARLTGRPFVDLDDHLRMTFGMSVEDYILTQGQDAFRARETEALADVGARSGIVIACGGGVVTRPENYDLLHQNGSIVLIERDLDDLSVEGRPISQQEGVERLAAERGPLYHAWADATIRCTGTPQGDARAIAELFGLSTRETSAS